MQRRVLDQLCVTDTLDLDGELELLPGGTSPLALLSPNNVTIAASPARTKPPLGSSSSSTSGATDAAAAAAEEEENEPLGALPVFGGRKAGSRRPDPRRQSLAIGEMFAGLSAGAGLLGESELAVGDEEIQVPLAKSGKLLGGASNHSSLFVDPDTDDLLEAELPSPLIHSRDQPVAWKSPALAPGQPGAASSHGTPAMRVSTVFGDLSCACEGLGLDDFDGSDFQLQESNKVKELAVLFKMPGTGSAASTPRASAAALHRSLDDMQHSLDAGLVAEANLGAVKGAPAAESSDTHTSDVDATLATIKQRLQDYDAGSSAGVQALKGEPGQPAGKEMLQEASTSQPAGHHQQEAQQALPVVDEAAAAPTSAAAGASSVNAAKQAPSGGNRGAAAQPAAGSGPSAAAGRVAASSRLPVPPARTSRLRPPTTSSGFFSHTATNGNREVGRQPTTASSRPGSGGSRPSSRAGTAAGRTGAAAAGTSRAAAHVPTRGTRPAAEQKPTSVAPSASSTTGSANQPALSRLAQHSGASRIPTPSKPSGSRQLAAGSVTPAAAGSCPEGPNLQLGAGNGGQPTPSDRARVPLLRKPSPGLEAPGSASLTPNTARLRFLEQNPHLAFGGSAKLAISPEGGQELPAKKLTAEQRHLRDWQDHL